LLDDKNAHLFTPAFALSYHNPSTPPNYSSLSPADLDALLQEMEPDIREADRSLSAIAQLEKQGVTGAGKLEEYEPLLPRMTEVLKKHKEDLARFESLESRMMDLLESYGERVDLMTQLFVEWNELVEEAESTITKLEKDKEEKQRLGLR
jgi:acyl-CoA reductase-like NAD-dependent aldehyde dehydrogenase